MKQIWPCFTYAMEQTTNNQVIGKLSGKRQICTYLNIGTANHFLNIFVTSTYSTNADTNPARASIR